MLKMLKSKIHQATVTDLKVDYKGSLTIDRDLMEAANILPHEQVHVWNITNGERLFTYTIPAPRGSGTICLNGAAAKRGEVGDKIIIATFVLLDKEEARSLEPKIVHVDENNKLVHKS